MNTLLPPNPISLPHSLPSWYIFPQRLIKRSPKSRPRYRKQQPSHVMTDKAGGEKNDPPWSLSTGEQHWEEQRRLWTRNDLSRTETQIEEDLFSSRIKNANHKQLVKYYNEIVKEERSFRLPVRLSSLIPILNAGWKDAGLWPNEDSLAQEILAKGLNPNDYNLKVHLSSVIDSDASPEKSIDLEIKKVLSRQNARKSIASQKE